MHVDKCSRPRSMPRPISKQFIRSVILLCQVRSPKTSFQQLTLSLGPNPGLGLATRPKAKPHCNGKSHIQRQSLAVLVNRPIPSNQLAFTQNQPRSSAHACLGTYWRSKRIEIPRASSPGLPDASQSK